MKAKLTKKGNVKITMTPEEARKILSQLEDTTVPFGLSDSALVELHNKLTLEGLV